MTWTTAQIEFVSDKAGYLSNAQMASRIGKSEQAVKLYRSRHNMPTFYENVYTASLLAEELGKSRTAIRKWYYKGLLKGKHASWTCAYGKRPLIFTEDDIVAFLKTYPDKFIVCKIKSLYFANVVRANTA